MQITIKSVRSVKTGTSKKGDWELISVVSSKGTEYTTFDKKVKQLGPDSIIEIGEPDEKDGKLSFKKVVEVVSEAAPRIEPGPNGKPSKSSDQFDQERRSVEAQTAFEGIIELAVAMIQADKVDDHLRAALDKALAWAKVRLDSTTPPSTASKPAPGPAATTTEAIDHGHFENAGQFAAAAYQTHSLKASELLTMFSVKRLDEIKDLDAAWKTLG